MRALEKLGLHGKFRLRQYRRGLLIAERHWPNLIVDEGMNLLLAKFFDLAGNLLTAWRIGLVDITGFSAFSASDTLSSHAGWTEATSTAARSLATWAGASGRADVGTALFTSLNIATIHGAFVTPRDAANTDFLWAEGSFTGGDISVVPLDNLVVEYDISG